MMKSDSGVVPDDQILHICDNSPSGDVHKVIRLLSINYYVVEKKILIKGR